MKSATIACRLAALLLLATVDVHTSPEVAAQSRPGTEPATGEFETVSVKPHAAGARSSLIRFLPNGISAFGATLRSLILFAYSPDYVATQIVSPGGWVDTEPFDLEGRVEGRRTAAELRGMLRRLLVERFGVKTRLEDRRIDAMVLTVKDSESLERLRQKASKSECRDGAGSAVGSMEGCGVRTVPGSDGTLRIIARDVAIAEFAKTLSGLMNHVVRDETGLEGRFDLNVEFSARSINGDSTATDNLAGALNKQLGLLVRQQRSLVPVLVIDAARLPTAN